MTDEEYWADFIKGKIETHRRRLQSATRARLIYEEECQNESEQINYFKRKAYEKGLKL